MTGSVDEFVAALVDNDSLTLISLGINARQECIARPYLFLGALLRRAPRPRLEDEVFLSLALMLRMIIAEAHRNQEYSLVRWVYCTSRKFGRMKIGQFESASVTLGQSQAFADVDFWVESAKSLIFDDIERWTSTTRGVFYPEIGKLTSLSRVEVNTLIAVLRTQGLFATMQHLQLPLDLRSEFLSKMETVYCFRSAGINVEQAVSVEFKMWILQVASKLLSRNYVNPKLMAMLQKFSLDSAHISDEFGYFSLLELLLTLPERCRLKYRRSDGFVTMNNDSYTEGSYNCFCGESANTWFPVRLDGSCRSIDENSALPSIICERCFQQLLSIEFHHSDIVHDICTYCEVPPVKPIAPTSLESVFSPGSSPAVASKFNLDVLDQEKLSISEGPGSGPEQYKTRRTSRDSFESLPPVCPPNKRCLASPPTPSSYCF